MAIETPTALLFPGQGLAPKDIISYYELLRNIDAHYVQERVDLTQEAINKVNGSATFNLVASLENVDSPDFQDTAFVQPTVCTLSVLAYELAPKENIGTPQYMAGHSLGEYSALIAAGVISFEEGITIVSKRGRYMKEDCQKTASRLVSINGLTIDKIQNIYGQTEAATSLINAPTLIVVSCLAESVPNIKDLTTAAEAKPTILLTAGGFHSFFMEHAQKKLIQELATYQFITPRVPIVSNYDGQPSIDPNVLKDHLGKSMTKPVQWADTIAFLAKQGISNFRESGPGTSLASLNRYNGIPKDQTVNILT